MTHRITDLEYTYVKEVLDGQFRSHTGATMMKRLERTFAETFETEYAISHINGTATMHSILEAWGIGPGDEVIVPPLTMASTSFAVLQAGATPVFADVVYETFQIDPASVAERVTEKTKAIITVALYGLSPDMDPIMEIAARHNLFVLEDNAECFLGYYKGRLCGTIGDAASFSFQSSKHVTSGEGGMVITNDADLALNVRRFSSLGYAGLSNKEGKITKRDIQNPTYKRHSQLGWNYRMPELCSAVALAQIERIDELVAARVQAAQILEEAISDCDWLVPQQTPEGYVHSYWAWPVRLEHPTREWTAFRDAFVNAGGDGIYAAWELTYLEPAFRDAVFLGREGAMTDAQRRAYAPGLCPSAERLQPKILAFKTNYWDPAEAEKQAEILRTVWRSL